MLSSVTSVFSQAEDFAVAMREEGCLAMLVTGGGQFRARLTQVALLGLRLLAMMSDAIFGQEKLDGPVVAHRWISGRAPDGARFPQIYAPGRAH